MDEDVEEVEEEDEDVDEVDDDDVLVRVVVVVEEVVPDLVVVGRVVAVGLIVVVTAAVAVRVVVAAGAAPVVFMDAAVRAWVGALAARVGGCVPKPAAVSSFASGRSRGGREIASAHASSSAPVSNAVSVNTEVSCVGVASRASRLQAAKAASSARIRNSAVILLFMDFLLAN